MLIRSQIRGLTTVVLANTLLMSLAIAAFAATDEFLLALPCVFVAGAAMVITGIGAQTLIQASVDHTMSGRVMALYGGPLSAPGLRWARWQWAPPAPISACACRWQLAPCCRSASWR